MRLTRPTTHKAILGRVLSFHRAPQSADDLDSLAYFEDGLIQCVDGRIAAVGSAAALLGQLPPGTAILRHDDALILPGFIDLHIHLPQTQVIASYGARLLDWLQRYTFVEEARYGDPEVAAAGASFFLDELARNGTTTAAVYGSVHDVSVEALFSEAARRGAGMIAGKVMMDRNAPPEICDSAQSGYDASARLIERWHGKQRQRYAVTPRFAVTSSPAQLEAAAALLGSRDGLFLQTHLSESEEEIQAALDLFPDCADYAGIYQRYGLLGPRSLLGHCLHLSDHECDLLSDSGSVAVLCPTSNLFLGSGLMDPDRLSRRAKPVRLGLATDVGGGTSYSMLRTAAEAYKAMQLQGAALPALQAFYWITRGNAEALGLDCEIGVLAPGRFADLVVLDSAATPAMARRRERCRSLTEELFLLLTMGDDRAVRATYLRGELALPTDHSDR